MSFWTHVFGTVKVEPLGYSEHAREFVLRTVLDHLPPVIGSEGDMRVDVVPDDDKTFWSSSDEFGQSRRPGPGRRRMAGQSVAYFLVLHGNLRDRMFPQTKQDLDAWLGTLARRVRVREIMVRVTSDMGDCVTYEDALPYYEMFEEPSYQRDGFETMTATRRCPDWRYDFMPDLEGVGNWCEVLPYLVPGGAEALRELDEIGGHLEWEDDDGDGCSPATAEEGSTEIRPADGE